MYEQHHDLQISVRWEQVRPGGSRVLGGLHGSLGVISEMLKPKLVLPPPSDCRTELQLESVIQLSALRSHRDT